MRTRQALPVQEQGNYVSAAGESPVPHELDPRIQTKKAEAAK